MALVPLRSSNAYWGIALQSLQGTPVAPTNFWRWEGGTKLEYQMKSEEVREGDTSRRLSLLVKNQQSVKMTFVGTLRPIDAGIAECAILGAGSDTYTAPTVNTTLSNSPTKGSTTFQLASNTGLTSGGTATIALNPGGGDQEIVTVTVPGTGTGPWTYTIANSGVLQNAHTAAEAVKGQGNHVLVDTNDGNYYTIEFSLAGTSGIILRIRDCKVNMAKVTGKVGSLVRYEIEFTGIAAAIQVSAATLTWDPRPPFLYTQGVWTLDGATTGDAPYAESFELTRNNNLDLVQTEKLIADASIYTKLDVMVSVVIVYQQSTTRIEQIFMGGPAGTTDAQAMALGSLLILFTAADLFHTLQFNVPAMTYIKGAGPEPNADGKHMTMTLETAGTSNMSANTFEVQTTINSTAYAAIG